MLLEANRVGWGASGRNGGQLGSGQRRDQDWLEARLGRDRARALWELAEEAKALVKGLIARHAIACDLRPGIIHAAHRASEVAHYHAAAEKLARDYGYAAVEPLDRAGIAARLATEAYHGGVLDRGAAHLHPLAFALGLARAAAGGRRAHPRAEPGRGGRGDRGADRRRPGTGAPRHRRRQRLSRRASCRRSRRG